MVEFVEKEHNRMCVFFRFFLRPEMIVFFVFKEKISGTIFCWKRDTKKRQGIKEKQYFYVSPFLLCQLTSTLCY
jgi:hypothetical protein